MCPKERRGNLHTVDTALSVAVQRFSKGSTALLDMMLEMKFVAGSSLEQYEEKENTSSIVTATSKRYAKEKENRKKLDTLRRQERRKRQEQEGSV